MNTMKTIRKAYLGITQAEMARITGASQSVVCRWERDEVQPDLPELARLREWVIASGRKWDDAWLFTGIPADLLLTSAEAA